MRVPVHIVSGFLGTGKTTLLLDQLEKRAGERVAVVVNDFGDASIDRATLEERGPLALTEIRGACVCCTAPEGFSEAMRVILDEVRPARIFVEPTGLARPSDLLDTLMRGPHKDRVAPGPLVVVVDPHGFDPEGNLDPRAHDALEAADVLVANRLDLATPDEIARFDAWVAGRWPQPVGVYFTTHGQVPTDAFEWPDGEGPRVREHAHDHDHDEDPEASARSWIWPYDVVFDGERLRRAALGAHESGHLLRFKGLFRTREGTVLLEVAGGRLHERPSAWRRDSRADVIVTAATHSKAERSLDQAGRGLEDARCTEAELRLDPEQIEVVRPDGARIVLDRSAVAALDGIADVGTRVPGRQGAAASVRALLDRAGAQPGLEAVVVAADGFASPPVPIETLHAGLLVHSLGDAPLPGAQGGPFRLLIPGDAGPAGPCSNVKGVVRIVLREPVRTPQA